MLYTLADTFAKVSLLCLKGAFKAMTPNMFIQNLQRSPLVFVFIFFTALTLQAQVLTTNELSFRSQYPLEARGDMRAVSVAQTLVGNYGFFSAERSGVVVVDISDPWQPKMCTTINTSGRAYNCCVSAPNLFIADGAGGLHISSITNIAFPVTVGKYPARVFTSDVAAREGIAYLTDVSHGLTVLDVKDASSPHKIGELQLPGEVTGITLAGEIAIISAGDAGIHLVDIKKPERPVLLSSLDTLGFALSSCVAGDVLVVTDFRSGVQIVDISEPRSPRLLASYDCSADVTDVCAHPTQKSVYLASGSSGVLVLDVSEPKKPRLAQQIELEASTKGVALSLDGEYLYTACFDEGMRIVDVRPGRDFEVIAGLGLPGTSESLTMQAGKLFVADSLGGVKILDPSNPYRVELVCEVKTDGIPQQVFPMGGLLYVADYRGLTILDITDLKNPELLGEIQTPGEARSVAIYKKFALIADGSNGVQTIHVEYPDLPTLSTVFNTGAADARKLYLKDKQLFVATDKELLILNASNPRNLKKVNKREIPGNFMDVFVLGDHAYLADYEKGLVIVDISRAQRPVIKSVCKTPGYPRGVWVSGNYAYIADYEKGLQVVNIKNSETPFLAGSYETSGDARGVFFLGKYAFVADGRSGVRVYESKVRELVTPE